MTRKFSNNTGMGAIKRVYLIIVCGERGQIYDLSLGRLTDGFLRALPLSGYHYFVSFADTAIKD